MSEDLEALETWAGELLAKLTPAQRRKVARAVGTGLRRANADRIAAQQNPDGSAYTPRKKPAKSLRARKGKIRRRAKAAKAGPMFRRLRTAAFLKVETSDAEVSVGFPAGAGRIARVHQDGLRDKVARTPKAPEIKYPQRILLGFTDEDRRNLLDLVLEHLEA